ncbi:hypothetical protein ACQP3C_28390, partial [Escherichia coli]
VYTFGSFTFTLSIWCQNIQYIHPSRLRFLSEYEAMDNEADGKLKQVGAEVKRMGFARRKSPFLTPILKQLDLC